MRKPYGGHDPLEPYYLYAYVNPFTSELVRVIVSRAMCARMGEALRGQGVTQLACHTPEDRGWHEAAIHGWGL